MLHINWLQTFRMHLRVGKPRSSSIRVLNHSNICLSPKALIVMDENSSLEINRQDYRIDRGSLCRIELDDDSVLQISGHVSLHRNTKLHLHPGASLSIGNNTYLNGAEIDCSGQMTIGKDCAIAEGMKIMDKSWHEISDYTTGWAENADQSITIGDHVWIATNAIILPGLRLGDGCIVAAGAVVTHDVPERCLVAGVPAKVIREEVNWSHGEHL